MLEVLALFCYIGIMTYTYTQLQSEVSDYATDLPTKVSTRLGEFVNRAIRFAMENHNFRVMEATKAYTTTASTRSLGSVPSDLKEWRDRPWYQDYDTAEAAGAGWHRMVHAPNLEAIRAYNLTDVDTGAPMFLLESDPSDQYNAMTLNVYPLPDGYSTWSDGEYRLYVPYYKYLADLSAAGDHNWLTDNGREFIVNYATQLAFLADWNYEAAAVWKQLAIEKFNALVKRDKTYRLSGHDTLVVTLDVNASRSGG